MVVCLSPHKPISIIFRLASSLYTFIRVKKDNTVLVWDRPISMEISQSPCCVAKPGSRPCFRRLCNTLGCGQSECDPPVEALSVVENGSGRSGGGGDESVVVGSLYEPDTWETFPFCCMCCVCCPTVQSTLKYCLWSALFLVSAVHPLFVPSRSPVLGIDEISRHTLVDCGLTFDTRTNTQKQINILFFSSCILQSRFWFNPGCPPDFDTDASGLDSSGGTVAAPFDNWECFELKTALTNWPYPLPTNCSALPGEAVDDMGDTAGSGGVSTKSCYRWVPQTPDVWLNTLALAATLLNFVLGAMVSVIGNQLHQSSDPDYYEKWLLFVGFVGFYVVAPVLLFQGLLLSPVAYFVTEGLPANLVLIARVHRVWRRQMKLQPPQPQPAMDVTPTPDRTGAAVIAS